MNKVITYNFSTESELLKFHSELCGNLDNWSNAGFGSYSITIEGLELKSYIYVSTVGSN